jgi:predicted Zn-dependent peptidase
MIPVEKTILSNGLRLLTVPQQETKAVTALFLVGTGSRFETPELNGISHFLEHILFKGTKKYPSPLLLSEALDGIGANFNAYTSHEYTGFYVQAEASHFSMIFDVLHEMFYLPKYSSEDVEREKGVIVEEINMYRDLPQRHVGDLLFELLYGKSTPMGRNIAGTKETVTSFTSKTFADYQSQFYTPDNIIVSISGNPIGSHWETDVKKLLGDKTGTRARGFEATEDRQAAPRVLVEQRETDQTHLLLGLPMLKETDDRMPILNMLNTILGGSMSSRLFSEIREKRGLAYYVRSGVDTFHDTGLLAVATGVRNAEAKEALKLILKELTRIKQEPVSAAELKRAKENFKGKLALGLEGSSEVGSFVAQQELYHNRMLQPEELVEQVEAVTVKQIQNLANEFFNQSKLNLAAVGPFQEADFLPILEKW